MVDAITKKYGREALFIKVDVTKNLEILLANNIVKTKIKKEEGYSYGRRDW